MTPISSKPQALGLSRLCKSLPPELLPSKPVRIYFKPHLKAHRGKLLSGLDQPGKPVHAASFIRRREVVLESRLLKKRGKLKLILVHELCHFAWARLGNKLRAEFAVLIGEELSANARGELGESAGEAKGGEIRNYLCESFCDTGAWMYSGVKASREFTLAARWRRKRRDWFVRTWGL